MRGRITSFWAFAFLALFQELEYFMNEQLHQIRNLKEDNEQEHHTLLGGPFWLKDEKSWGSKSLFGIVNTFNDFLFPCSLKLPHPLIIVHTKTTIYSLTCPDGPTSRIKG